MGESFRAAFTEAKHIIAAMPGFGGLTLSQFIEDPSRYLLLVQWESVEHHTDGFRGSPDYERWRELLHHFYEPFPVVEHYLQIASA